MKSIRVLSAVVIFLGLCSTARAIPIDLFVVSGPGTTVTFLLPASPTPTGTDLACPAALPPEFCISGVTTTVNGVTQTGDTLEFFDISQEGGLALLPGGNFPYLVSLVGAQLYTGPVTAPTFLEGSFAQTNLIDNTDFTVTITTIPEPGSLVLLASGGLGIAVLRRRLVG